MSLNYRLLAVDVDGTLLCGLRPWVTQPCLAALRGLRQRDIPVVVCTGRGCFAAGPDTLSGLEADYLICSNGAFVVDMTGKIVFEKRLSARQVETLTDFCLSRGYNLAFSFEDAYYVYNGYEAYIEYYRKNSGDPACMKDDPLRDRHLRSKPFGAYAHMPGVVRGQLRELVPDLDFLETNKDAYDICQRDVNKAVGLERILRQLDITWSEVVAVGDSFNDLEMLRLAGMGVVMGNAPPDIKDIADYVTGTVLEDGLLEPIERFFP